MFNTNVFDEFANIKPEEIGVSYREPVKEETTSTYSTEGLYDEPYRVAEKNDQQGTAPQKKCCWTLYPGEQDNIHFVFFLNVKDLTFSQINDFVTTMRMVRAQDRVKIYGPSKLGIDEASVVLSAMQLCESKDITLQSPHVLDLGAAMLLIGATKVLWSPAMYVEVGNTVIGGHGNSIDAVNALKIMIHNRDRILNNFKELGLLTPEEIVHITEKQGAVALYGKNLRDRLIACKKE